MKTRPLAVVTTRLPPATCGIGAFSQLLREHWPNDGRPVNFLVMEGAAAVDRGSDSVTAFNGDGAELARALSRVGNADVLLHYAGRAYHRLGFPLWMPRALTKWRRQFPAGRLMVFFHEVPGELPITSRHHWLGRLNSHVISRLAKLADVVITNTESHRAALRKICRRDDVQLLPIPSNIPAAAASAASPARSEFIIFGLPFGRWQTLQAFDPDIRRWSESGRLTNLHLVGPADDRFAREADDLIASWPDSSMVVRHGRLAAVEVSAVLGVAGFALTNVTQHTWSKSGAFMAAAASRCPIVVQQNEGALVPFSHTVTAAEVDEITEQELERRTGSLASWYYENADWPVIGARIAALWPNRGGAS